MTLSIPPFIDAMVDRWITECDLTHTPLLTASWEQMAKTFNTHIAGANSSRWSVLHPSTGTGKSTGLAVYCGMLPLLNHPGVLIVVRMKSDADALAEEINRVARNNVDIAMHTDNGAESDEDELAELINSTALSEVAIAVHTDHRVDYEVMGESPILIVTHSAYENAMLLEHQAEALTQWRNGKRKLTIIDEAIDIIRQDQVSLDDLRSMRGHFPYATTLQHSAEIEALDTVISGLTTLAALDIDSTKLTHEDFGSAAKATFAGLRKALKTLPLDSLVLHTSNPDERARLVTRHILTLTRLEAILGDWCLYARKGAHHTLTTSRVILPPEMLDAVVLDATASLNPVYSLLGDMVKLIDPPSELRDYSNVNLHVSLGHRVGKGSLSKKAMQMQISS